MSFKIYFDNEDILTDYGVFLIKSKGEQGALKIKKGHQHNWDDEHGLDMDLGAVYYDKRRIVLTLGIKAASKTIFQNKLLDFLDMIQAKELRQLRYSNIERVFMVYADTGVAMRRYTHWNDTFMVGKFGLVLFDPAPISRQYKNVFTSNQSVVTIDTPDPDEQFMIYWGDGTKDTLTDNGGAETSTYSSAATYYIVIAGNIANITTLNVTNATEI